MHRIGPILESLDHRLSCQGLALEGKEIHGELRMVINPSPPAEPDGEGGWHGLRRVGVGGQVAGLPGMAY